MRFYEKDKIYIVSEIKNTGDKLLWKSVKKLSAMRIGFEEKNKSPGSEIVVKWMSENKIIKCRILENKSWEMIS